MEKLFVLAGSRQEFEQFLRINYLTDKEAFYLYDGRLLMGRHDDAVNIVVYGTFWERKDAHDLYKFAHQMLHIVPPPTYLRQYE